ncbi:MAG: DUF4440 domain-containing protein [Pseudomonadota bacterium]
MRKALLTITAAALSVGVSAAQANDILCQKGADKRTIAVKSPGDIGQACDVRYTRGGTVTVPYHANNAQGFCAEKVLEIQSNLLDAGYSCSSGGQPITAAAPVRQAPPTQVASPERIEAIEEPADELAALNAPADAYEESDYVVEAQRGDASEPPQATTPTPASVAPRPEDVLAEPERLVAAAPQPVEPSAASPRDEYARIVGATAPVNASLTDVSRSSEQVIRTTLQAQAAAWNEGDLEGFMDAYWKSDDLKYLSDGNVVRGWPALMNRYRSVYGRGDSLGRLGFDRMDVDMITDEVAVVVGRYNHFRDGQVSTGIYSLVMKQIDGAWRIVHDHTASDAP